MCCIYNHGCEVISYSVLYLSGAEHIKENISLSLEPTNCPNSSTDRGGPAQQLLTPYPCWTLTNGSSVGYAQELQQPSVEQCEESSWKAFLYYRKKELAQFCLCKAADQIYFRIWLNYLWKGGRHGTWKVGILSAVGRNCNFFLFKSDLTFSYSYSDSQKLFKCGWQTYFRMRIYSFT